MTCALWIGSTVADMAVGGTWISPEDAVCVTGFDSREVVWTKVDVVSREDEREDGVWKMGG